MTDLHALAARLVEVPGVVAVALGGSRARRTHYADSDIDLGVYYRPPLDLAALRVLAREVTGRDTEVYPPGAWGRWVDGGAWLQLDGQRVDWIFRDLDRVHAVWADCRAGRYEVGTQAGHPLGFYSHAYAGEVALGVPLADLTGELTALREATRRYPDALAAALVHGAWEAEFLLALAAKGAARGDAWYVSGCLFRALGTLVQALYGHARRWVVNEKGAVRELATLPGVPDDLPTRINRLAGFPGTTRGELLATIDAADQLRKDVLRLLA